MRKLEQRLWDRMRKNVPQDVIMERIENVVGVGTPDIISIHNGFVAWTELKAVGAIPARPSTPVLGKGKGLTVEQSNWHRRWNYNRGHTFVLVGIGSEQLMFDWYGVKKVNDMTLEEMALRSIAFDWRGIADILRGQKV